MLLRGQPRGSVGLGMGDSARGGAHTRDAARTAGSESALRGIHGHDGRRNVLAIRLTEPDRAHLQMRLEVVV